MLATVSSAWVIATIGFRVGATGPIRFPLASNSISATLELSQPAVEGELSADEAEEEIEAVEKPSETVDGTVVDVVDESVSAGTDPRCSAGRWLRRLATMPAKAAAPSPASRLCSSISSVS